MSSSSSPLSAPTALTLTPTQIPHLLSLYPSTLEAVYGQNGRLKDGKKRAEALEEDAWRYGLLPRSVAECRGGGGKAGISSWLEKGELERLVGWKITHGTYRPFLPSLIRQNSAELVKATTTAAFDSLTPHISSPQYPQEALATLTKALKGVGPATATLLLSIHDPENIPFFSDELYGWLLGCQIGAGKDKLKLKYDIKEYRQLFDKWVEFGGRIGRKSVRALDAEKVAYVLGHWDVLTAEEKRKIWEEDEEAQTRLGEGKTEGRNGQRGKLEAEVEGGKPAPDDDQVVVSRRKTSIDRPLTKASKVERSGKRKLTETAARKREEPAKDGQGVRSDGKGTRQSKRLKKG